MINKENFPNAYKEVYVILNNMDEEYFKKVPQSFFDMLHNKMNNNYNFELNSSKEFEEKEILQETKVILAYLFINYWATESQKERILSKFKQDIEEEEIKKQENYSYDNLFNNKNVDKETNIKTENNLKNEDIQLIKIEDENFFVKIFNKIKRLFKF